MSDAEPPVLATEGTPALDGWGPVEPDLGALVGAYVDDLDPRATEDVALELHALLVKLGVRHIAHYDGPEQSITLRLDKNAAASLSSFIDRED